MSRAGCGIGLVALVMSIAAADAQSATNMAALKGLAPVSALSKTVDGTAALGANFTVTGGIQTGAIRQPTLHAVRGTAAAGFARRLHHRRQFGSADRRLGHDPGRGIRGARALSRPGALHQHLQIRLGCDRLRQLDKRLGFQRRKIFLRQRNDERQKAGFRRGPGHLQGYRRRPRSFWPGLWPTRGNARRRPLRQLPPVPDRAHDPADRGAGLLQRSSRQSCVQPRPGHEPDRQPILPERAHDLRLHGLASARGARARSVSGDGRARRGIRQRPHHHGGALRHGRAGRANRRDLRPCASARQRPRLHRPAAEGLRQGDGDVLASGSRDHRRLPRGGRDGAGPT